MNSRPSPIRDSRSRRAWASPTTVRANGKTVIRGGFGIYYSQIVDNSEANYALTGPTGVFNYTAAPGQIGFPTSVAAAPLPAFPAGAQAPLRSLYLRPGDASYYNQFFPTNTLIGYPSELLNPISKQWTIGIEHASSQGWVLSVDYVGSHTLAHQSAAAMSIRPRRSSAPRPARCAPRRPPTARVPTGSGGTAHNGLDLQSHRRDQSAAALLGDPERRERRLCQLRRAGREPEPSLQPPLVDAGELHLVARASITSIRISPARIRTIRTSPAHIENGNAIFDQRQRFVLSGLYILPWKIEFGGVATLASGLPYNYMTGLTNSGDTGATTDRPVINGVVVGRNTGRGGPIYDIAPFLERPFTLGIERLHLDLRAEAFNVFNHANFVGYSGTYGNGATPGPGFGAPLVGITNQLPARSVQFSAKFSF